MLDCDYQMYEEVDLHDTLIDIRKQEKKKKRKKRRACLYFSSRRQLERSRMSKKSQTLTRVADATMVETAKTLDFEDVNTHGPSIMDLTMCGNLKVVNEEEDEDEENVDDEPGMVRFYT